MSITKEQLKVLAEDGAAMTREQAAQVLEEILAGEVPEVETAALLAVLATRGEQAPELAGFVDVMRKHVTPMPLDEAERETLVDRRGAGGCRCRGARGQARQPRGYLALRHGRRAGGVGRAHRP